MANGIELAKAYVQIVPSADGIKGGITKALGGEADSAGKAAGGRMMSAIKGVIASAGIGKALSAALTEGANLEQSIGGIETLFKDNAGSVIAAAQNAYKTAGLSANAYMETVTSFSASLLQSLGGDTEKAAAAADAALTDMADNANKMGTSMELIQNAYQGFAKGNYTMLDNLKLGYGGTQEEMKRLLKDAQKLTGVKYDISNLADVYSAIHVVQEELGIAGATAAEASTTLSGSFASMKAAASNVLGNLTLGQDIAPSLAALGETVYTFAADNLLPMVGNLVGSMPQVITGALSATIQAMDLAALNADTLIEQGVRLVVQLASGIPEALPRLVESGLSLIGALIKGVINATPDLLFAAVDLIKQTAMSFVQYDWLSIGSNIIDGISSGITGAVGRLVSAAMDAVKAAFNAAKEFLGIRSPSRLFRDQIGAQVAQGMALGITDNTGAVTNAMTRLSAAGTGSIQSQLSVGLSTRSTAAAARGVGVTIGQITFNGYDEQQGAALVRSLNRQLGRLCT